MAEPELVTIVRRYLAALAARGIHARRAVVFGSFARNQVDQWSDIDLVVIAPEFDRSHDVTLVEELWLAAGDADDRIEPIACGEREWEANESRPILEIARREGIEIAA